MDGIRRNGHSTASFLTQEDEAAVSELADTVGEVLREQQGSSLEPFEIYSHHIRAKILANPPAFKERFNKGYRVLIQELGRSVN